MRQWYAIAIALGVCVVPGLSAQQTDLPHAFPREGAVQVMSNDWISAWEVTWPVNAPTPMHRHRFDYLGVELEASQTRLTAPDGGSRDIELEGGLLWFLEEGTTHAETGLTQNPERHAIIIDLRGAVPQRVENNSGLSTGPMDRVQEPDLDNERVSMWSVTWSPDRPEPLRFLERPVAIMFKGQGTIEWTDAEGSRRTESYRAGQVELLSAGRATGIRALDDPVHVVLVEFKR